MAEFTKRDFTKNDFKQWLVEHQSEIVGWVGYPSRPTPIFNYAQARGWKFESLMPKWAYKCAETCEQYPLYGRYTGWDVRSLLYPIIGL